MSGIVLACLLAVAIGAVTARLMRVAGLVIVLCLLLLCGLGARLADLPVPTLLQTLGLMVLVQAGYLGGALVRPAPAPDPRKPDPRNPAPPAEGRDRKAG
ncbi:MAG: hypothetical protein RIR62_1502 [Pseudomonadota bacterium]|jgi:ABC-type Na+ efflux pump permease subunit